MYVRFEGQIQNDRSSSRLGIFQLAYDLRDSGDLPKYAEEELLKHLSWLKKHLTSPAVLSKDGRHRSISWFHPRAKEPLKRIRSIKVILEDAGYDIDQVEIRDPGNVIYEDGWEVVATPRKRAT